MEKGSITKKEIEFKIARCEEIKKSYPFGHGERDKIDKTIKEYKEKLKQL